MDRPDLKFQPFTPRRPQGLATDQNIFESIHAGDILLHHPFDSFLLGIEFLKQSAADPKVPAIKQTLYQTGFGHCQRAGGSGAFIYRLRPVDL